MSTRQISVIPSTGARELAAVALFLDVDGTLLDLAQTPDSVQVQSQIVDLVRALWLRTGGALAFVSGRKNDIHRWHTRFVDELIKCTSRRSLAGRRGRSAAGRDALPNSDIPPVGA